MSEEKNATTAEMFQHTYICPSVACLKDANPHPGSWHQRAINLPTDVPRNDVKCPGCGGAMIIGRNGHSDTYKTDREGNITEIGGDPLIFEKTAAEAPDQSGDESIFLKDGK